jgi:hypothetical protein
MPGQIINQLTQAEDKTIPLNRSIACLLMKVIDTQLSLNKYPGRAKYYSEL